MKSQLESNSNSNENKPNNTIGDDNLNPKTTIDFPKKKKKNQKGKVIDFMDYAQSNGIKINIQYEDSKPSNQNNFKESSSYKQPYTKPKKESTNIEEHRHEQKQEQTQIEKDKKFQDRKIYNNNGNYYDTNDNDYNYNYDYGYGNTKKDNYNNRDRRYGNYYEDRYDHGYYHYNRNNRRQPQIAVELPDPSEKLNKATTNNEPKQETNEMNNKSNEINYNNNNTNKESNVYNDNNEQNMNKQFVKTNKFDKSNHHQLQNDNMNINMSNHNNNLFLQNLQQRNAEQQRFLNMQAQLMLMNMNYFSYPNQLTAAANLNPYYQTALNSYPIRDEEILDDLEKLFKIKNLNRDIDLRNNMDENGWVDSDVLLSLSKMQRNKLTKEKIINIIDQIGSDFIEMKLTTNNTLLLRNKNFDIEKSNLLSIEAIKEEKEKQLQMQQQFFNQQKQNMFSQPIPGIPFYHPSPMMNMNMNMNMNMGMMGMNMNMMMQPKMGINPMMMQQQQQQKPK